MNYRRPTLAALAVLVMVTAGSIAALGAQGRGGGGGGGGKPGITTISTIATFTEEAIRVAGGGSLVNGEDGVSSYRVEGSNSTNGWSWNLDAKRTKTPRSLIYDLTAPADATTTSARVVIVHDTHGQIYDLSTIPEGQSAYVRGSFHFVVDDTLYVVLFGQTSGDGSSPLLATRGTGEEADTFWVRTHAIGDVARLMLGNGPGEVLLGYYHVPFSVVLESQ